MLSNKIRQTEIIIEKAIETYNPAKIVLLVSGGHDSVTSAHISSSILAKMNIDFMVYHGDTTIGIPETQFYVKQICDLYKWKLSIRTPPDRNWWYDKIVEKHGFPGPTKATHQIMYRRLKERALRKFVTHECKSSVYSRENIMLLTGVRAQESKIRMGYKHVTSKEDSKVWCNSIFYWLEEDCKEYMRYNNIPLNPVKETIGISGECLCGCFSDQKEWELIEKHYPHVAAVINELAEKAKENGFPWHWASSPKQFKKDKASKRQCKINFMCAGCE